MNGMNQPSHSYGKAEMLVHTLVYESGYIQDDRNAFRQELHLANRHQLGTTLIVSGKVCALRVP